MTIGSQMPELDRGLFCPLPYKIGSQNTLYKLGLKESHHAYILVLYHLYISPGSPYDLLPSHRILRSHIRGYKWSLENAKF